MLPVAGSGEVTVTFTEYGMAPGLISTVPEAQAAGNRGQVMYTKAQFTRLGSFEEATHGWFWGSYRDIFGALRGPKSGFEGGGGFTGGGVSGGSWQLPAKA